MNKNKLKYVSVPQDSFKFEHLDRIDSEIRPVSLTNYDARVNEICLTAAENETSWVRYKSFYTKTELITVTIGTICSISSILIVLFILLYTDFYQLIKLIPDSLFQHPFFYLMVEILSLVLDTAKIYSIKQIWDIFSLHYELDIVDDGTAIAEAVHKLKTRCIIRKKLLQIKSLLFYLNAFVYIYYLLFVVLVKYSLAIYLSINYETLLETSDSSEFCNSTRLYEAENCVTVTQSGLKTFLICFLVFLYLTASLKLIVQTISFLNFKNVLGFYLIVKFSDADLKLWSDYELNKSKLFMNEINDKIEESQAYFADKFFNTNPKETQYINEREPRYLNETEQSTKMD